MTETVHGRTSCVVVAFHRPASLRNIVAALTDPSIELVVVNVGNDPQVASVCADGVVLLNIEGNPGYGSAVNAGARICTGDVVVYLNDDVLINREDVYRLATPVRAGEAAAAVPAFAGPEDETNIFALPTPMALAIEWMALPDRRVAGLDRWFRVQKWRRPATVEQVDAASGAVVAVARDVLTACPLPEEYFMYWEDMAWCWRLRQLGYRLEHHPEVKVGHDGGRNELRAQKSALMARNAVRCVRLTQGRLAAASAVVVVVGWNLRLLLTELARVAAGRGDLGRLRARAAGMSAALLGWRELR